MLLTPRSSFWFRSHLFARAGKRGVLLMGLLLCVTRHATGQEMVQSDRLSRLRIPFDQAAHVAAVQAKAKAAADRRLLNESTDPDVLRLPNYTVTDERIDLEPNELLTAKGKVELAKQRYLTPMYQKTLGPVMAIATFLNNPLGGWKSNTPEAMAIYQDFEMLRRKRQLPELTALADLADRATAPRGKPKKPPAR